ncbi:TIGR01459 family HAD-type hydrolase [Falsiroseomonas selenitidurans]|uniref:TIGR01459 family HAD-type hydrolase n=1 Tax=Falsiroseomonas selenitidurans TaxID=2716335 RepID=A0ABX1E7U9_9PROT|nr:TIGR01459 family HAD-type hydrolase [Falsiroseomonas selenitidurans]NKC32991.1 TIGR01459 family HAD-type hydrolase [Falsiroseomonas selenitidurans]
MKVLDGVAALAADYDGFILDLWGVVHDGRRPYPGVAEALGRLKAQGKRIAFLSNAPRRSFVVDALLTGMGLDRALWDGTMTSGEIAWRHLKHRERADFRALGVKALHIGPERDLSVPADTDVVLVRTADEADFVLNTGPEPARGNHDIEPYRPALEACAARRLPMLCVNPDRHVMVGDERVICAGALADLYRDLGGPQAIEIGKPDPDCYPPVLELLGLTDRARVVAIGDSPHTDLAGAQAAGIDAVWALTGLAAHAHGESPDPVRLAAVAAAEGVRPVAALMGLRW